MWCAQLCMGIYYVYSGQTAPRRSAVYTSHGFYVGTQKEQPDVYTVEHVFKTICVKRLPIQTPQGIFFSVIHLCEETTTFFSPLSGLLRQL